MAISPNEDDDDGDGVLDWWQGVSRDSNTAVSKRLVAEDDELIPVLLRGLVPQHPLIADATDKLWHVTTSWGGRVWYPIPATGQVELVPYAPQGFAGALYLHTTDGRKFIDITGVQIRGDIPSRVLYYEATPGSRGIGYFTVGASATLRLSCASPGVGSCMSDSAMRQSISTYKCITLRFMGISIDDARNCAPQILLGTSPAIPAGLYLTRIPSTSWWVDSQSQVAGAVTDGASPCVVRAGGLLPAELALSLVKASKAGSSDSSVGDARIVGSFSRLAPIGGSGPAGYMAKLPELPIRSAGVSPSESFASFRATESDLLYVPPDSYIDVEHNPEFNGPMASELLDGAEKTKLNFDLIVAGERVARRAFWLRRPPVVLIHGINSGPETWTAPSWTTLPSRVFRADWSGKGLLGYAENIAALTTSLSKAQRAYRTGNDDLFETGSTALLHPVAERSKFAMTQADVVAHSQGGQITRMYLSSLRAVPPLGQIDIPRVGFGNVPVGAGWPPMRIVGRNILGDPWFNYYYEYSNSGLPNERWSNYMSGDIRRFVPIGSPFNGSPIADLVEPYLRPEQNDETLLDLRRLAPPRIMSLLFSGGGYIPPTCVVDLGALSAAENRLAGVGYGEHEYGRSPQWLPIVGLGDLPSAPQWIAGEGVRDTLYGLVHLVSLVSGDVDFLVNTWPTTSDLIVPASSQRNLGRTAPSDPRATAGRSFNDTAHIAGVPSLDSETGSEDIAQFVIRMLSRPLSGQAQGNWGDMWLSPRLLGGLP